jgi:hypothetical protein
MDKLKTWIKAMLLNEEAGRFLLVHGQTYWPMFMDKDADEVLGPCGANPFLQLRLYKVSSEFPHSFTRVERKEEKQQSFNYVDISNFETAMQSTFGPHVRLRKVEITNTPYKKDMAVGTGAMVTWKGRADEDYDPAMANLSLQDLDRSDAEKAERLQRLQEVAEPGAKRQRL